MDAEDFIKIRIVVADFLRVYSEKLDRDQPDYEKFAEDLILWIMNEEMSFD